MMSCQVTTMSDRRGGGVASGSALSQPRCKRIERSQLRREQLPLALAELAQLARLADVVARQEPSRLDASPASLAEQQRGERDAGRLRRGSHKHVRDADCAGGNLALE